MASHDGTSEEGNQTVPDEEKTESVNNVKSIQSHYLRCPSPTGFSMISESRFSMISGSDTDSIFMEPIHLSSALAAKQIINEELKPHEVKLTPVPESMKESAKQLMVEDLYNRVKDMIDDRSLYNTPCVLDIQRAMVQDRLEAPLNQVDEVWPNIFIGEKCVAVNKSRMKRMGITHVLNAAHGTGVYTSESFYAGMNLHYMGIEVDDFPDAEISLHFRTAAEFLDEALLTHKGKVLVCSMMGVSRSAVLVAAYLMIFHHMTIMDALLALRKKRPINPNEGFLKQLRQLNETLLEERDDDDDTLSQCSVIDTRTRQDEEESMMGVKAQSIMAEEEEDGASIMSSVASSAAALRACMGNSLDGLHQQGHAEDPGLPGEGGKEDDEDDVSSMIREWQQRNEKYQDDDWWEAQLMCEDSDSLPEGVGHHPGAGVDLESVTSEEVQAVMERMKRRQRRAPSDSVSTASCTSYSDLWKQKLREIEEQAAARYRNKKVEGEEDSENGEARARKREEDVESVLSDTSSLYNFCKNNKDKLTPLERWRVKRIQFGWNKKNAEAEKGSDLQVEPVARTPALEDVNLTAYQTWKLKQQKRLGGEEDKDEILELSRGEDSAKIKKRQRREEILERSRKTLEESQSVCGWETESSLSGSTIPLSAFWAGATGPQSVAADDSASMLSGRSSVLSQAQSTRSQSHGLPPGMPQVPMMPMATMQGPGGEPMVNLASIQNWIANVVTETLIQKQGEIMSLPPSNAGSVLSLGLGSSLGARRGLDDDKASMLSGSSYSSSLYRTGVESVLSASNISGLGSCKSKITTTSVPLYSLFQDQVNLSKLDSMDKEIKSEMREKMATYKLKKITEDNKRSTLYKKKKPKEEEDEEADQTNATSKTFKPISSSSNLISSLVREKPQHGYTRDNTPIIRLSTLQKNKTSSIDEWLSSVRPPSKKPTSYDEDQTEPQVSTTTNNAAPEPLDYDFPSHRTSYVAEEEYDTASRYHSRFQTDTDTESSRDPSPEPRYQPRSSPLSTELSCNVLTEFNGYTARRYNSNNEDEEEEDYISKRKSTHQEEETSYVSQSRLRSRAQREEKYDEDDVIAAWRAQQESRSHT